MILSFHPNIVADRNILCAGRLPREEDREAICRAQAVILPQGCGEVLYRMCRRHCPHVFPNYDARFDFPGKCGQASLFQQQGVSFPRTYSFHRVWAYRERYGHKGHNVPLALPCILKFDWGGEGEGVFLVETEEDLEEALQKVEMAEGAGLEGFLLQDYVPCHGRSLRVVIIGDMVFSYWRCQQDRSRLHTNVGAGAVMDHHADPGLQESGQRAVRDFCSTTGINLAAFDLIFPEDDRRPKPFFLEINYFFGRRGLGGSAKYYELIDKAVAAWLNGIGLCL